MAASNAISMVLQSLRLSGVFYCRTEVSDSWALTLPHMDGSFWFHAVLDGACLLYDQGQTHELSAGDFALLTRGQVHRLGSDASAPAPNVLDLPHEEQSGQYARLRYGGGGDPALVICGLLRVDDVLARGLLGELPALLYMNKRASVLPDGMEGLLTLMGAEAKRGEAGSELVTMRLADILVVQVIRHWLKHEAAARTGRLGALQDPLLGRALACMHQQPERAWTVAELAKAAAMSRSAFGARFKALIGSAPLAHLTQMRMLLARDLLLTSDKLSVGDIATRVGYQSETAFCRAFKREFGNSPGVVRNR